jgi:hypothetical protein
LQFGDAVRWRVSKRGLVVVTSRDESLLIEHTHAADLPDYVCRAATPYELFLILGGSPLDRRLVGDLLSEGIVIDSADARVAEPAPRRHRMVLTKAGLEISGMDTVARSVHRVIMPILTSWVGRIVLGAIVVGGVLALVSGRPSGPQVSHHPRVDATVGFAIGLFLSVLHELAHGVSLVHYGASPGRAGFGFYWGDICFYVDCTEGTVLPRRARVVNALAGLAVDVVTISLLLIVAHFATPVLIMSVCWRLAILGLLEIAENGLPLLEVDGQVALADFLDEPDLAARCREALGRKLRRISHDDQPRWLATYGATSLVGGLILVVGGTLVWWSAVSALVGALFSSHNAAEILIGIYTVVPVAVAFLFSTTGLFLDLAAVMRRQRGPLAATR